MQKFFVNLMLAVVVSLPMVKDGDTVYNFSNITAIKQVRNYIVAYTQSDCQAFQIRFDSTLEANWFLDTYADWLKGRKL